jgi:spoIIIJ-associated protein
VTESTEVQIEATGETVGEAKWAALKELEQLAPGFDRSSVQFTVISEGERGLLGVGYTPARVIAQVPAAQSVAGEESEQAAAAREFVGRITSAIGADVTQVASERDDVVTVTCAGADIGLVIGRHGQTIDAIQYLANAVVRSEGGEHVVVVDAAGYRARRASALEAVARRAAKRAASTRHRVELDPMTAVERKIVHELLKDDPEVETLSEGTEPNRFVAVVPRHADI